MALEDMLADLPADRPAAALLRHAARQEIETVEDSYRAALTPAGHEAARRLGGLLRGRGPVRLAHSPVGRCRETAEGLAAGLRAAGGSAELAGSLTVLGGPYMRDFRRAMEVVLARGAPGFVRDWFDGRPGTEELVCPFREAARGQAQALLDALRGGPGLWLGVSHDWNLLLLREAYLGLRHERDGWPGYLEAVLATEERGRLVLRLGARWARLELPLA